MPQTAAAGTTGLTPPPRAVCVVPHRSRVVVSLDVSPSMAGVNSVTGVVVFDEVLMCLAQCLAALTQPFVLPGDGSTGAALRSTATTTTTANIGRNTNGSDSAASSNSGTPAQGSSSTDTSNSTTSTTGSPTVIYPEVWLTLLVQTHPQLQPLHPVRVLLHGVCLTRQSLPALLDHIRTRLTLLEASLASVTGDEDSLTDTTRAPSPASITRQGSDSGMLGGASASDVNNMARKAARRRAQTDALFPPAAAPSSLEAEAWDVSFPKSLRHCIFAATLLPADASAALLVLTDGVVAFPDQGAVEAVLERFFSTSISCSFVQIGAAYHPQCSLGEVPDTELLHFLATATGGGVFFARDLPPLPPSLAAALATPLRRSSVGGGGLGAVRSVNRAGTGAVREHQGEVEAEAEGSAAADGTETVAGASTASVAAAATATATASSTSTSSFTSAQPNHTSATGARRAVPSGEGGAPAGGTAESVAAVGLPNRCQRCVLFRCIGVPVLPRGSSMTEHVSDVFLAEQQGMQRPPRGASTVIHQGAVFQGYRPPPVMVYRKKWSTYVMAVDLATYVFVLAELFVEEREI